MIVNFVQIWLKEHEINNWISIVQIVSISSKNLIDRIRKFQVKKIYDIYKDVTKHKVIRVRWVPVTISDVEIFCHN